MTSIFGYPSTNEASASNNGIISSDLEVQGKLKVDGPGITEIFGSKTSINTTDLDIKDNAININKGAYGASNPPASGVIMETKTGYSTIFTRDNIFHFLNTTTIPNFQTSGGSELHHSDLFAQSYTSYSSIPIMSMIKKENNQGYTFEMNGPGSAMAIKKYNSNLDRKDLITFNDTNNVTVNVPLSITNGVENKLLRLDNNKNMVCCNIEENEVV